MTDHYQKIREQPEALRLADALDHDPMPMGWYLDAAEELRRLHTENERLRAAIRTATHKQRLQSLKQFGDEHDKLTYVTLLLINAVLEEAARACEELNEETFCNTGRFASGKECAEVIRALREPVAAPEYDLSAIPTEALIAELKRRGAL